MQFQVKHEPPMMRGLMEHISSVNFLQHKGGNCLDIGLSLGTDCPQEKERYTIGYDRGDKDYVEVADKVIKQEDGLRSAIKRKTAVSFLDWGNKDEYRVSELKNGDKDRDLERVGSGMSTLSGCGGDSDASGDEPRKASSLQYKGGSPWEIQGIWMGAFNNQADVAVPMFRGQNAMNDFKPTEQDHIDRATVRVEEDNNKQGKPSQGQGQGVEQNGREDDEKKLSREHMFDKAVTPSDVGKLNRLVIPKQHAEKFFPLDTNANEKGLLLNFEDNVGKAWRFRYSYWNSSQSYVLTKGWSRFVKEKKLYAGDIVSFERGTHQNVHRLFISWRRRPCVPVVQPCFTDPSKTLIPTLPCLTRPNIQYRPFQSHGLNISTTAAAAVGRQAQFQGTVIPACSKVFPQWMSLVWPDNGGGTSSRSAAFSMGSQMWAPVAQPQQMDGYFHPNSKTADLQDTDRVPLDFMQLGAPEKSQGDVLWPMETKIGAGFDPSTSKKGVRLFGVNL